MAKKKNRGNGEGSVYNNGKYWVGQITIGRDPTTGKLKRKSIYGKSRASVVIKMTESLHQINTNTFIEPSKMLIEEWADYWLDNFKKNQLGNTSYANYSYNIDKHIKKPFGPILLCELNVFTIQQYYNTMKSENYSSGYIKYNYIILNMMLKQAVTLQIINKNPCKGVALPKLEQKRNVNALSQEEQEKLVHYLNSSRNDDIFMVLLGTGMRIGEVVGLSWDNVDFAENHINVSQIAVEIKGITSIQNQPKSASSKRQVPIGAKVREVLLYNKEKLDTKKNFLNLVFPSNKYTIRYTTNVRRQFTITCRNAGIRRINVHALRHTFATRMLESDVNIKVLSSILGHKNIQITLNTYAHVFPDFKKESIEKIEEFL